MKVKQFFPFLILITALFWGACGEKENCCDLPASAFDGGVFVVNEGPWGGTGTISWYNPDSGAVIDSVYEKANNGAVLGQFVQSLTFHNGKAYIVVNGANRVVVADAATFRYIDTIGGLELPRFFLPLDEHSAYISQWGADGLSGSIAKVDLHSHTVVKTIPTGAGPEKMVLAGDKVYVANSGGYGADSSITEILLAGDIPTQRAVQGGKNPGSLVWNNNNTFPGLYYLCRGYYLDTNPSGWLDWLGNTGTGNAVPAYSDDLVLNPDNGEMYFAGGSAVYRVSGGGQVAPLVTSAVSGIELAYGLNYLPAQKHIYCADANNFTAAGTVHIFSTTGAPIGFFRAGIAPGEIVPAP